MFSSSLDSLPSTCTVSSGSLTVPSTTGIAVCPCLAVTLNEIALTTPGKFPQCTLNYMNSMFSEF